MLCTPLPATSRCQQSRFAAVAASAFAASQAAAGAPLHDAAIYALRYSRLRQAAASCAMADSAEA